MFQRCGRSAALFPSPGMVRSPIPPVSPALPRHRGGQDRLALLLAFMIALVASCLGSRDAAADPRLLRGPGGMVPPKASTSGSTAPGILAEIAATPVLFYQRFLGRHWGNRCAYYPSCSHYALLAIRKHGALVGTMLAFDRLQHETNEGRTSPRILVRGEMKLFDPLENNDYWWYKSGNMDPAADGAGKEQTGQNSLQ